MVVTIDHDNDEVRIEHGAVLIECKVTRPSQVQDVLSEIFNLLAIDGVALRKQDEGTVRTLEEW